MKIIYHPRYTEVYASDPAASGGRMEAILKELEGKYDFVEPDVVSEDDLKRVHSQYHIESIRRDRHLYDIACLAAGGAIKAAQMAMEGEVSFGLIRPPGHHASRDHCWGFCFFNNIAVALAKLQEENLIEGALILDFDLHFGDGTSNIFAGSRIKYFQPAARGREEFVEEIVKKFQEEKDYSILAVSAGFDRHIEDWGGQLTTDDYRTIGRLVKEAAEKNCKGRRFAVLEGGYNHSVLGKNVVAFLEGLG
ncbi:MAG: histone deacetylase family protein [Chloroflexi bacterium]|nr:histone deacetylase family protein [Chloroflexota bacterium]